MLKYPKIIIFTLSLGALLALSNAEDNLLRLRLKPGGEFAYTTDISLIVNKNFKGQQVNTRLDISALVIQEVSSINRDSSCSVSSRVGNIKANLSVSGNPIATDSIVKEILIFGRLTPYGKWENVTIKADIKELEGLDPLNFVYNLILPSNPIEEGETWTRKIEKTKEKGGIFLKEETEFNYTLINIAGTVLQGEPCRIANIDFNYEISYSGLNTQGKNITGTGNGRGEAFINIKDGTLVKIRSSAEVIEKTFTGNDVRVSNISSIIEQQRTSPAAFRSKTSSNNYGH
ncbi:MAG: hypothetical protein ABIA63_14725 [bacterium]